jgi:hypothetical protein
MQSDVYTLHMSFIVTLVLRTGGEVQPPSEDVQRCTRNEQYSLEILSL